MSWQNCDPDELDLVASVARELATATIPDRIMLVGARCRDLHHRRCGFESMSLRSTSDVDMAIALPDWADYEAIRSRFSSVGKSGHRFTIAGTPTDVIAFGGVENPPGTTSQKRAELNVHGFRDAYTNAEPLPLPGGLVIRIPKIASYAVLKTHAWLDRSPNHHTKDGPDLALAVHWYAHDTDRMYDDNNRWALELHDFDLNPAAAALLSADMRSSLSPDERMLFDQRVATADLDHLAVHFSLAVPNWPETAQHCRHLVAALFAASGRIA